MMNSCEGGGRKDSFVWNAFATYWANLRVCRCRNGEAGRRAQGIPLHD